MRNSRGILSDEGIDKNFKFMILEVTKQLDDTQKVFEKRNPQLIAKIDARDDYIDNLKSVIENKCYYSHLNNHDLNKRALDLIRAVNIIGINLERIGDHAVSIVSQLDYLDDPEFIHRITYKDFFDELLKGLKWVERALRKQDINLALKICRSEYNIDLLFKQSLQQIIHELALGENTGNLVTLLFIIKYLERMGDSILNIGEAVIFAGLGEKLKIHDFEALEDTIDGQVNLDSIANLSIKSIWETRSGCRISRVENQKNKIGDESRVIFKEGRIKKLKKEYENILSWEKVQPGLTPKVFNYHQNGKSASILVEFLNGKTIQQAILDPKSGFLKEVLSKLKQTLVDIWGQTKKETPVNAHFLRQLQTRLDEVYKVHREFEIHEMQIGQVCTSSLKDLLIVGSALEKHLDAPFSVRIHGDFNIDNVLYDLGEKRIHFIDLYRSENQDYVQDLSVFLASNFRQPIFDPSIRSRLDRVINEFFDFGKKYARKNNDTTYEVRMALGLARSFLTSTRFEFNDDFAEAMRLRSVYLLEKVVDHEGNPWSDFKFPEEVLYY